MPPPLRLITPSLTPSTRATRCLHKSFFPPSYPNGKKPSKYNIRNKRSDDLTDVFQWSTLKRPTNGSYAGTSVTIPSQINTELNALNQLRINPVDIDPNRCRRCKRRRNGLDPVNMEVLKLMVFL